MTQTIHHKAKILRRHPKDTRTLFMIWTRKTPCPDEPTTILDALAQQAQETRWAMDTIDSSDDGHDVSCASIKGTAKAGSDGSFKNSMGMSASNLYGTNQNANIITVDTVPGNENEQSAYRSELVGI
jgi:hypothetical protein